MAAEHALEPESIHQHNQQPAEHQDSQADLNMTESPKLTENPEPSNSSNPPPSGPLDPGNPRGLSKNALKKLRKKQEWEAGREDRKVKRREKLKVAKQRKRERIAADPSLAVSKPNVHSLDVPVAIVMDCSFDELMQDKEIISLGRQLTHAYSANRGARFRPVMCVSSFEGRLKERFDGLLAGTHKGWKGVRFVEGSLMDGVKDSAEALKGIKVPTACDTLKPSNTNGQSTSETANTEGEVIYLSSESPDVLTTLKSNSTYIIGGLVDKNRHKGICYKRAREAGIKTARLPIGEHFEMSSRKVLATNHVLEILVKWLELSNWGAAFESVIPARKGGKQRQEHAEHTPEAEEEDDDEAEEADVADSNDGNTKTAREERSVQNGEPSSKAAVDEREET